jgi:hypothetical protein
MSVGDTKAITSVRELEDHLEIADEPNLIKRKKVQDWINTGAKMSYRLYISLDLAGFHLQRLQ